MNDIEKTNPDLYAIETFNLCKDYTIRGKGKKIQALRNVNLKVKDGEIFGLLGPNGAGKTTFVSILTTLLQPTTGYAKILGKNILKYPWFVKNNIGLMLGGEMIYYRITGYKNLIFFSKIYGIKNPKSKIREFAEIFNLSDWLNQYVSNYSTGMKVKLALIRVLITDPKILFLDEPMLGVDPNFTNEIIKILKELKKTILLTSHQMNIVERLCDRIGFLKKGKIVKIDTQENFKNLIKNEIILGISTKDQNKSLVRKLGDLNYVSNISQESNIIYFNLENRDNYSNLFEEIKDFKVNRFKEIEPDLNDIFIKLSRD